MSLERNILNPCTVLSKNNRHRVSIKKRVDSLFNSGICINNHSLLPERLFNSTDSIHCINNICFGSIAVSSSKEINSFHDWFARNALNHIAISKCPLSIEKSFITLFFNSTSSIDDAKASP